MSIINKVSLGVAATVAMVSLAAVPEAGATSITLGNAASGLISGSTYSTATVQLALTGLAPFNSPCGSDTVAGGAGDCTTHWTFSYVIPAGDTITAADLMLGIYRIGSASGSPVALYQVNGGDVLTSELNAGAVGSIKNEYDVFDFALSSFGALSGGSATVQLTLQGHGIGGVLPGGLPSHAADLVFSTLDLTLTPGSGGGGSPVPEPATLLLLTSGLAMAARSRARRKPRD